TMSVAQLTGCKNFSRAVIQGAQQLQALDWGCNLEVIEPIPKELSHVGIRAHQIIFSHDSSQVNSFPCWVVRTSETPHRMTLFLKLHGSPNNPHDYHLQAEVFKEKWVQIKDKPFPWYLRLDPMRLILMV
ncbi:MAG: molybdate ABC transporter permease subunit, partial [Cyanobacteria bacterium Co-bin13]|nr:molybdate ABC transporter permease subunit [Cyanobacteria bacterium Co-bin13]